MDRKCASRTWFGIKGTESERAEAATKLLDEEQWAQEMGEQNKQTNKKHPMQKESENLNSETHENETKAKEKKYITIGTWIHYN